MKRFITLVLVVSSLCLAGSAAAGELDKVLGELEQTTAAVKGRSFPAPQTLEELAGSLKTLEAIYGFVKDEVRYEGYTGRLKGASGTLAGRAGNDLDQCELLMALLRLSGRTCRYAEGRLDKDLVARLLAMGDPAPREADEFFGGDPAPSATRTALKSKLANHYWVQVQDGSQWIDIDPCFSDFKPGMPPGRVLRNWDSLPPQQVHRVRLEVQYRAAVADRGAKRHTALVQEFEVADLYGKALTLANLANGTPQEDDYALREVQPVLRLGSDLFPGKVLTAEGLKNAPGAEPAAPAKQMMGLADRLGAAQDTQPPKPERTASLRILGEWLKVTIMSPGHPADRFTYTIFDSATELAAPAALDNIAGLDRTVALAFSSAPVTEPGFSAGLPWLAGESDAFTRHARRADSLEFGEPGGEIPEPVQTFNDSVIDARRALAWMMVQQYLRASDQTLAESLARTGIAGYYPRPRAIIASLGYTGQSMRYDLDLQRNEVRFVAPAGRPAGWEKFLSFTRGMYEARLEGAVLRSFSGETGITAGEVFDAAQAAGVPIRVIDRSCREKLPSRTMPATARGLINSALGAGRVVLVPEKPVTVQGREHFAWFEVNPATGFAEAVFPNGKHQSMTEDAIMKHIVTCIGGDITAWFATVQVGAVFGLVAGLNHFLDCAMAGPAEDCFGAAEVCGPARADAKKMCEFWGVATGLSTGNFMPIIGAPDMLTVAAGDPCELGMKFGLAAFGCMP